VQLTGPYYDNTRPPLNYGHPGKARGLLTPLLALPTSSLTVRDDFAKFRKITFSLEENLNLSNGASLSSGIHNSFRGSDVK
jgi:hypothetical protein